MEKMNFSVKINAPAEKVWSILWNDASYRAWTSVFSEGSYAVSDWKEGSRVQFMAADGGGMYSRIAKMSKPEIMSFEHLGEIKDGKEQPVDEKTKQWAGAMETYTLHAEGDQTQLRVEMDITEEYASHFREIFPKALEKVRELSEKK